MADASLRFFNTIPLQYPAKTWIECKLQDELEHIVGTLWRSNRGPSLESCPLDELGEYLLRVLQIVTSFADRIINGSFISEHATARLGYLVDRDDGSTTAYLDEKCDALK
jgi:hypothetical protein